MAPSWGTSCLRSRRRILSIESMRGLRPPWTQRTEPEGLEEEPLLEDVAPVPAGPVRVWGLCGLEEGMESLFSIDALAREKRLMIWLLALRISISTSSRSRGRLADSGVNSAWTSSSCVAAPVTRAPKAR